jgi:tetratricopeptide (TPR) repeat protein
MSALRYAAGMNTSMRRCAWVVALLAALGELPAAAQSLDEAWTSCQGRNPDVTIPGCTAVIAHRDETDGRRAIAFTNIGSAWGARGDLDRALMSFGRAIELNPSFAGGYGGRAMVYELQGQFDSALADLNQVIRLDAAYPYAISNRARVYLKARRIDEAIADYDAALKLQPRDANSLYGRSLARQRKGDSAGANADMSAARLLRPDIADEMMQVFNLR